jgi:pyridoxamine 5'-phosphate oxidase family protein
MSVFSKDELDYMSSQRLGRLATVGKNGAPHVVPVGFKYNPKLDTIDIIGANLSATKKMRDLTRDPRAALVIDDVLPPWQPRGIEIRGTVVILLAATDHTVTRDTIRLTPGRIIAWGIETDPHKLTSRAVTR